MLSIYNPWLSMPSQVIQVCPRHLLMNIDYKLSLSASFRMEQVLLSTVEVMFFLFISVTYKSVLIKCIINVLRNIFTEIKHVFFLNYFYLKEY